VSNFKDYSFDRQLQRFAMVALYFSTEGGSWSQKNGWLVNKDECTWYQTGYDDECVNGTLRVLSLSYNNLNGLLPNEIALLSLLEVLDLTENGLRGAIPMEIKKLSSLTILYLGANDIGGTFPTEIGG
jgi:lysophospholipase L1-like esterase